MTNDLQSFDNKAYVGEESNKTDPNDNSVRKYTTKDEFVKDEEFNNNNSDVNKPGIRNVKDMSPAEIRQEKSSIMKNVIVISFAFLLLFTSFQSMSFLQSSINKIDGLGTWSNVAVYAALVASCMFLPSYVIKTFTVKWGLVMCMFCYTTYIATQFYPQFYTIIPGAIIVGIGAAPMWSAKCTYLTQVGNRYAELSGVAVEPIIVRFFGIFFLFFQSSSVWGHLISSAVLSTDRNVTETEGDEDFSKCGVNYCPAPPANQTNLIEGEEVNEDKFSVTKQQRYILAGVYLICSVLSAVIVALFVDPLSKYGENERSGSDGKKKDKLSGSQLLVATFKHMKKPYQLLVIPLTLWSGVEQGFLASDYTAGYVSCVLGVHNVGYVLICYGIFDALFSVSFGAIIKYTGRVPIFVLGALINLVVVIILFEWTPNSSQAYVFFILAAMWGIADAVWQTQINALYGVLFENDEEAAFSNYRLWESAGFIIAFILQNQICIFSKLWVVLVVLAFGMTGYLIIEANEWAKNKRRQLRESGGNDAENGILHTITSMLSCINTETRV